MVPLESKAGGEYIRKKSAYCSIQQLMLAASFRSYVKTGNFVEGVRGGVREEARVGEVARFS